MSEILGNIEINRGDSYPLILTVRGKTSKLPLDLTGYTGKLTVTSDKDPIDATTKVFDIVGVVDPDQVTNKGRITFTPTSVNTQTALTGWYDIELRVGSVIRSRTKTDEGQAYKFTISQDRTK